MGALKRAALRADGWRSVKSGSARKYVAKHEFGGMERYGRLWVRADQYDAYYARLRELHVVCDHNNTKPYSCDCSWGCDQCLYNRECLDCGRGLQ